MQSSFNKYRLKGAYHYGWYENEPWYKKLVDRAVRFCDGETLDVGCGDGLLASKLNRSGKYAVLGVDKDPEGLRLARRKNQWSNVGFIEFDIENDVLGEGIDSWDYMTCLNVIEHLDRPESLLAILDNNIIKGAIISTIDYQGGSLGEDHRREYTAKQLLDFFKAYNPKLFRIEDIWIGVEIRK